MISGVRKALLRLCTLHMNGGSSTWNQINAVHSLKTDVRSYFNSVLYLNSLSFHGHQHSTYTSLAASPTVFCQFFSTLLYAKFFFHKEQLRDYSFFISRGEADLWTLHTKLFSSTLKHFLHTPLTPPKIYICMVPLLIFWMAPFIPIFWDDSPQSTRPPPPPCEKWSC